MYAQKVKLGSADAIIMLRKQSFSFFIQIIMGTFILFISEFKNVFLSFSFFIQIIMGTFILFISEFKNVFIKGQSQEIFYLELFHRTYSSGPLTTPQALSYNFEFVKIF
jgi:hypothetical protein